MWRFPAPDSRFPIFRNGGSAAPEYSRAPWNNISGGSPHPEWWLSNSGQVAQTAPEYSLHLEHLSKPCSRPISYFRLFYYAHDKSNKKAIVHVPVFPSEDNSPIAVTYGNGRIAMTLANYGITHGFIDSELVPDQEINERFGF